MQPSQNEHFELATYKDERGGCFEKGESGGFLQLVVDGETKTAGTGPGASLAVKINPAGLSRILFSEALDKSDVGATCQVVLASKEDSGGPREQKLVFEATRIMGREENGRIHARRFVRWLKNVNPDVDYHKMR